MVDDLQQQLADARAELETVRAKLAELEAQLANTKTDNTQHNLEDEIRQRLTQRLEALHQLDRAILAADSLESLAEGALEHVVKFIPCVRATISTADLQARTTYVLAVYSQQESLIRGQQTYRLMDEYVASITNDPFLIIDQLEHSSNSAMQAIYREGIRAILTVPLRADGEVVGLLNLHTTDRSSLSDDNIQIALEVAAQIAIGIHKTGQANKLARYARRMEILHGIDLGIIQGGSVKALVANTLKQVQKLIPCERIGVGVIEHHAQEVVIFTSNFDYQSELNDGTRIPIPPNWLDGFDSNGIRLISDLRLRNEPPLQRLLVEGFQSQLQVLLRSEYGNIGVMGFSSRSLDFFTPEHEQVAVEVANQLAIALHQMQLTLALERHAAELEERVARRTAQLQASKDQIEAILQNSLDGILLIDRDLRIRQANPAVSRLLSVKLDNQEVVNLLDLLLPVDAERIKASIELAVADQVVQPVEIQAAQVDGELIDMEFKFGYIPGDGLVSTIHDITTRKQAEAALKDALSKEKELAEAKSRFVTVTSHEFRNPLAAILTAADTLLNYRDRLTATQIDERLHRIRRTVLHMADIMEDILQLGRLQSERGHIQATMTDLDALVRSVIDELVHTAHGQDRIEYASSTAPLEVECDPRVLKQVISNLIANALKYSPPDKQAYVSLRLAGDRIVLTIRDEGIGIPKADLPRLFEPFHRAANTGQIGGTGLGLSITKQIVDMHHGEITVESEEMHGTTFTVTLPITQPSVK